MLHVNGTHENLGCLMDHVIPFSLMLKLIAITVDILNKFGGGLGGTVEQEISGSGG